MQKNSPPPYRAPQNQKTGNSLQKRNSSSSFQKKPSKNLKESDDKLESFSFGDKNKKLNKQV